METTTKTTEKVQASKGNKEATRLAAQTLPSPLQQRAGASLAKLDSLSPEVGMANVEPDLGITLGGQIRSSHYVGSQTWVAAQELMTRLEIPQRRGEGFLSSRCHTAENHESHVCRVFLCKGME